MSKVGTYHVRCVNKISPLFCGVCSCEKKVRDFDWMFCAATSSGIRCRGSASLLFPAILAFNLRSLPLSDAKDADVSALLSPICLHSRFVHFCTARLQPLWRDERCFLIVWRTKWDEKRTGRMIWSLLFEGCTKFPFGSSIATHSWRQSEFYDVERWGEETDRGDPCLLFGLFRMICSIQCVPLVLLVKFGISFYAGKVMGHHEMILALCSRVAEYCPSSSASLWYCPSSSTCLWHSFQGPGYLSGTVRRLQEMRSIWYFFLALLERFWISLRDRNLGVYLNIFSGCCVQFEGGLRIFCKSGLHFVTILHVFHCAGNMRKVVRTSHITHINHYSRYAHIGTNLAYRSLCEMFI